MKLNKYNIFPLPYLLIAVVFVTFSGCSKPYVGTEVDTGHEAFCRIFSFPAECTKKNYEYFVTHFKITKLDDEGNYHIKGYFDPTKGSLKSWGTLQRRNSQFRMIFVFGNEIVDNKVLPVKGSDMGHKLTFEFDYHTDLPIDAIALTYRFHVRG